MNRVFVLDTLKKPLAPCQPKRARELLTKGKAAVYRYNPFTIILKRVVDLDHQDPISLKLDPGGTTTGMALVGSFPKQGNVVLFAAELTHRSREITKSLKDRRGFRSGRRGRNLPYREPRFDNRSREDDWLPPSILSRLNNLKHFAGKFKWLTSLNDCDIELGKFDAQKMDNSEIKGKEYQKGALKGFSTQKDYLAYRDGNRCFYCGTTSVKLQKEHVIPNGTGSNSVRNLVLACISCNQKKSNRKVTEFLLNNKPLLTKINQKTKGSLWGAAALNTMRNRLVKDLTKLGFNVYCYAGYETKYNREKLGLPKEYWIDSACVGDKDYTVHIPEWMKPLLIKAIGRGSRRVMNNDKYGFIKRNAKGEPVRSIAKNKRIEGFSTGDFVKLVQDGCTYFGKVMIRSSGRFDLKYTRPSLTYVNKTWETRSGKESSAKNFKLIQRSDGYEYQNVTSRFDNGIKNPYSFIISGLTFKLNQPVAVYWGDGEYYLGVISDGSTESQLLIKMNFGGTEAIGKEDLAANKNVVVPIKQFISNEDVLSKEKIAKIRVF